MALLGRGRWGRRRRGDGPHPAARAARTGLWGLAAIVRLITGLVVLVIAVGIAFVVFKANPSNSIVNAVNDAAKFLAGPFDGMFKPDDHRLEVAINWGIAIVVYAIVGSLIARLLRR